LIIELENYLLSIYKEFSHPLLEKFTSDVMLGIDKSNAEYCKEFKISQKTFIKHSKQYLKRTPNEFKRVTRFRKASEEYNKAGKDLYSLTDLSYSNGFFDQAHMIKDFKSLTKYTPKEFFLKLSFENPGINRIYM